MMLIFLSGSFTRVPEENIYEFTFPKDLPVVTVTDNIGALNRLFSRDFDTYVNTVVVWNKLYKRSLFDGICYPIGKLSEDEFTTYQLLCRAKKFVTTSEVIHAYVQRKSSIMGKQFAAKRFDVLDAYEQALVFFEYRSLFEIEMKCFARYLETIIEFVEKAYKSGSSTTADMLCMLYYRFDLLWPRICSFFEKHTELAENKSYFDSLKDSYYDWKEKVQ